MIETIEIPSEIALWTIVLIEKSICAINNVMENKTMTMVAYIDKNTGKSLVIQLLHLVTG